MEIYVKKVCLYLLFIIIINQAVGQSVSQSVSFFLLRIDIPFWIN